MGMALALRAACNPSEDLNPQESLSATGAPTRRRRGVSCDALKGRFGAESVFFDTKDVDLGSSWQRETEQRLRNADVVLAVIGPHWVTIADERTRRRVLDAGEEDLLRLEIETGLRQGALVVPVLVDEAPMPAREMLPRPFKPLPSLEATTLRHASWDQDLEALMESLEQRVAERRRGGGVPSAGLPVIERQAPEAEEPLATSSTGLEADHFADVAECFAQGSLVAVLGAGANAIGRNRNQHWGEECGAFPDADELAECLARRFRLSPERGDLARVSQHIFLTRGPADLHKALRELLVRPEWAPGPVHRFLARVPARLREAGVERYPLIVTVNYDTALERAFDAVHEPFDLAVFMASGEDKGRFVHIPWWDGGVPIPGPIRLPNEYVDFPIDDDLELARTVIVKIHGGALHDAPREYQLKHNFLITEDEFITFLSRSPVQRLVPVQILEKLRESHFLFLGYGVREWTFRVFLSRVWDEQPPGAHSWAVHGALDK